MATARARGVTGAGESFTPLTIRWLPTPLGHVQLKHSPIVITEL